RELAQQLPDDSQVDGDPAVPVVDEHAAPAGRAAGGPRVVAAEQVRVSAGEALEVVLDDVKPQPVVGDDLVEVRHQVVLGHGAQRGECGLVERVQIDVL